MKRRSNRIKFEITDTYNPIKQTRGDTLVLNWVEVDTEAVSAILRERLGR